MTDDLASFRELKGIGPATEAKLHEAGVYTWAAFKEIVTALGTIRRSNGDTLRELSGHIADRASAAGGASAPPLPSGERSEVFIVRMSLDTVGRPSRSTVTHVRTQSEHTSAGWLPDEVIRFIEEQTSMVTGASAAVLADVTPAPIPTGAATASRDHLVVLDAGKIIGGSRRTVELVVSTAKVEPTAEFEYRANLASRPYGQAAAGPSWTNLAGSTGRGQPPDRLRLHFADVELPAGVQRLRLEMQLRLPSATREVPILEFG